MFIHEFVNRMTVIDLFHCLIVKLIGFTLWTPISFAQDTTKGAFILYSRV